MPFNVLSNEATEQSLRNIPLARGYGYALIPQDWIVLNEDAASSAKYGFVFEARNGEKYDVPHFVLLSEICYWDIPARDAECSRMDSLIKKHSRACKEAFKHQVEVTYEKDESGHSVWINEAEWSESFVPGHFNLPIQGAKLPYCEGEFPFGAHIVRPDGYDYEQDNRFFQTLMSSSCDSSGQSPIDD